MQSTCHILVMKLITLPTSQHTPPRQFHRLVSQDENKYLVGATRMRTNNLLLFVDRNTPHCMEIEDCTLGYCYCLRNTADRRFDFRFLLRNTSSHRAGRFFFLFGFQAETSSKLGWFILRKFFFNTAAIFILSCHPCG